MRLWVNELEVVTDELICIVYTLFDYVMMIMMLFEMWMLNYDIDGCKTHSTSSDNVLDS